jgi:cytoskeleton protein RodZ
MSEDGGASVSNQPHEPLHALRHARESAGVHIAALAAGLKVPVRKLEALESGRYGELPDLTFARALASSACRQLKVDPRPVLEQIPQVRQPVLEQAGRTINATFKSSVPGASSSQGAWFLRPSVMVAALLGVAALALLLMPEEFELPSLSILSGGSSAVLEESSGQRVERLQLEPSPALDVDGAGSEAASNEEGALPQPAAEPSGVSPDASAGQAAPGSAPAEPASSGERAAVTAPAVAATSVLLNITATSETWVEVTNGAGTVVTQRVLRPGDVIEFSSSPPYKVILGRADAARVMVRGNAFDVTPFARNQVARFEVK